MSISEVHGVMRIARRSPPWTSCLYRSYEMWRGYTAIQCPVGICPILPCYSLYYHRIIHGWIRDGEEKVTPNNKVEKGTDDAHRRPCASEFQRGPVHIRLRHCRYAPYLKLSQAAHGPGNVRRLRGAGRPRLDVGRRSDTGAVIIAHG